MTTIARGNTGRLSVIFSPTSGVVALADVTLTITSPASVVSTPAVSTDGTNRFYADIVVDDTEELGTWTVLWESDAPSPLITVPSSYIVVAVATATVRTRGQVRMLIERVRRQLDASVRHETNQLAVALNDSDTTITVQQPIVASLRAGAILSIDRELMRVTAVNVAAFEVTVVRSWQDSALEAHVDGAEILISPRFTRQDIYEAMIAEIDSWTPELFRVISYETTVTDDNDSFELPIAYIDALGLVDLRRRWDSESTRGHWPTLGFRTMRGTAGTWSGATESGLLVRMLHNGGIRRNGSVHAQVAIPFDVHTIPPAEDDDLIGDYGLEASMLEVVELGIKMRILGDAEIGRSARTQQDEPRRAEETPPGAALTVAQTIRANYARRKGDEVRKLQRRYKVRAW